MRGGSFSFQAHFPLVGSILPGLYTGGPRLFPDQGWNCPLPLPMPRRGAVVGRREHQFMTQANGGIQIILPKPGWNDNQVTHLGGGQTRLRSVGPTINNQNIMVLCRLGRAFGICKTLSTEIRFDARLQAAAVPVHTGALLGVQVSKQDLFFSRVSSTASALANVLLPTPPF